MRTEATRWLAVATITAVVAAALIGIFALVSGTETRAAIGLPIAVVAAVAIFVLGPKLASMVRREDRVAIAINLAVFGICTIAGIVATDRVTSADEAARYIGYFITLVVAKYVADGLAAVISRGRSARGT